MEKERKCMKIIICILNYLCNATDMHRKKKKKREKKHREVQRLSYALRSYSLQILSVNNCSISQHLVTVVETAAESQ